MTSPIEQLVRNGESETFEVKGGNADVLAVAQAVCGMLNQRGGIVLWGVEEPGQVVGLTEVQEKERRLNQFLMERLNPRPLISISHHTIKGKELIGVEVPFGYEKPYSLDRKIWVRIGTRTLQAGPEQSAAIVEKGAIQITRWEREPTPGFSFDDCDSAEIHDTRDQLSKLGRFGTDVPDTAHGLFVRLYLTRNNLLTHAAMVLFAADPLQWAPNLWIRVVSFAGEAREQLENDAVFAEPAVRAVKRAIVSIQQRTGLSGQFSPHDVTRQQRPAYALFALREGLVNAVVHRDYDRPGQGVLVEIFPDKLVISNPGSLPDGWSGKDLERKHESRPANPDIARVFYLRGLMEQLGLGTQKVVAACEELGAKRPKWDTERGMVSLTLFRAPEPRELLQVEPGQRTFLHGYETGKTFKVADYARAVGITERHARRELGELERKGLIAREGAGPSTAYRVVRLPH